MCFSAPASFIASGVLGVAGGLTLREVKAKKELPFASIPILFATQQFIEGMVWLSFGSMKLNATFAYAYSLFSHVLWPIFVPLAILKLEPDPLRKKFLQSFCVIGAALGLYLLYYIGAGPITATVVDHSISYDSPALYPWATTSLYLLATCGSCLFSSYRTINVFGVALFVSYLIAALFYIDVFFSIWCFAAALLSVIIFWHFKTRPTPRRRLKIGK